MSPCSILLRLSFAAALLAVSARGEPLRVAGSDLLGLEFYRALAAFGVESRVPLALAFDGSEPAVRKLEAGSADLAIVIAPEARIRRVVVAHRSAVVGYFCAVVLVPAECPVREFRLGDLARIFGGTAAGPVRWGDFGAGGEWRDAAVRAFAPLDGAGLALPLFRHEALGGESPGPFVSRYRNIAELKDAFAGASRVVALCAAGEAGAVRHAVPAALAPDGKVAVLPTAEHIHAGEYPLRLPVCVIVRDRTDVRAATIFDVLAGREGRSWLVRAGMIPVPSAVPQTPGGDSAPSPERS